MSPRTLVFVHAHPDDEALLTAGTMAKAAAQGHRVVLIVATDGAAGLASSELQSDLAATRAAELAASAAALGVSRTVSLGYPDSGLHGEVAGGFASASRFAIGQQIADVCDEEAADILVGYDASGGYGHPDHLQVHRSVRAASVLCARAPRLFEATLPREPIARAVHAAAALRLTPRGFSPGEFDSAWTPSSAITHRVDVRSSMPAKAAALRAHGSQATADGTVRTLAVLTRLPSPVQRLVLGTEYYVLVSEPHTAITSSTSLGAS
ncbi:MAG: PIG-L family deacetylase [Actinomycetes bacterium]